jgi:DNA repair protein RadC
MYLVKEMPEEARPRERLISFGPTALSNEELVAILLRTGMKDMSVLELSKKVLYHLKSFDDLKKLSVFELLKVDGIKIAKASTLIAAIELGRRLSSVHRSKKETIKTTRDVYNLLEPELSHLEQEHFVVIFLNIKSEVMTYETIFKGTIHQTLIHPREIFKTAIKLSAAAVIFVHNHPTGDSTPSKADLEATEGLKDASRLVGIDLIDHIVIGKKEYYSIRERKKYMI